MDSLALEVWKAKYHVALESFRNLLVFSRDTAQPSTVAAVSYMQAAKSLGHCAAVAILVQRHFGGELVSTKVRGQSHWFNRIEGFDVDLTIDQFEPKKGLFAAARLSKTPPIIMDYAPAGKLWDETRIRTIAEVDEETMARANLLALRSGFLTITEKINELSRILQSIVTSGPNGQHLITVTFHPSMTSGHFNFMFHWKCDNGELEFNNLDQAIEVADQLAERARNKCS